MFRHIEALEGRQLLASVPAGFLDSTFAAGLNSPTAFAFAPDGRLFVSEQGGDIRVIKDGELLSAPFLTHAVNSDGERGMLGLTFDPSFASNHYVYVYYTTASSPVHNRVARFTANGDVAAPGSEQVIFDLNNLSDASNHNGGAIHFGPDGKLYIAAGENATPANSQKLSNLLGKILRINADGTIPTDNPFYTKATGKNRAIWALGLRNPYTFAFQPGTGKMFINDVGQGTWEEINTGQAGTNYGWPNYEGYSNDPKYQTPLFVYSHDIGCAITGGTFYDPQTATFPAAYVGQYFFSDYCGGWIHHLNPATKQVYSFATDLQSPVDLAVGPDGALYHLDYGSGEVGRIAVSAPADPPTISNPPHDATVAIGERVEFTVTASGQGELSYQWRRNDTDIPGATRPNYIVDRPQPENNGDVYTVRVTNAAGPTLSDPAALTVSANHAPQPTILTPVLGATYRAGTTIGFSGSATDAEDGNLPAGGLSWKIVFHHESHTHPAAGPIDGVASGTFKAPRIGETSPRVWYRIILTATDSQGASRSVSVDVRPQIVKLLVQSLPSGLNIQFDGQPFKTPRIVGSVVGMQRALAAPLRARLNGKYYEFVRWTNGGARVQSFYTPAVGRTIQAIYRVIPDPLARLFSVKSIVRSAPQVIHRGWFSEQTQPSLLDA